jgi:hypothetical protein
MRWNGEAILDKEKRAAGRLELVAAGHPRAEEHWR